jgi:hypothetical protein
MMTMTFALQVMIAVALTASFSAQVAQAAGGPVGKCETKQGSPVSPLIATPSDVPYGSISLDWWRWAIGANPFTFEETEKCTGSQIYSLPNKRPVFFLAGVSIPNTTGSVDVTRTIGCNVPKNTYLMIPVVNSASALSIANTAETETLLDGTITRNSTLYLLDLNFPSSCQSFSLTVDSKLVTRTGYTILSPLENFSAGPAQNALGQSLGTWVILRPLCSGKHVVKACTDVDLDPKTPGSFKFCVTYKLTVR